MSGSVGNNPYRASGVVASLSAGREGTVDWDTTIHTSTVTAESGTGYFVNTNGGAVTVNLPAASVGDIVGIKDYAGTFQTNACTVAPNGSEKIGGGSDNDPTLTVEGESVLLVYADSTQGWLATQQSVTASPTGTANYLTASGGNQPTASGCVVCTNYKIHKFTSPGTFTVSEVGDAAQNVVSYLVVAGAGGGAGVPNVNAGGSGGAGGFREYKSSADCYTASPLNGNPCGTAVTVSATGYPIVIGAGGAGSCSSSGCKGNDSSFAPITSTAGGQGGAMYPSSPTVVGGTGGSGGGAGGGRTGDSGAAGNTPPTTPPQGNPGGPNAPSAPDNSSGGGGGAGGAGGAAGCGAGGAGGAHINTSISGADVEYSGGSGGAGHTGAAGTPGGGGSGVAKGTSPSHDATAGTANTGGSGGGSFSGSQGMAGGSGIVYIRYRFQ